MKADLSLNKQLAEVPSKLDTEERGDDPMNSILHSCFPRCILTATIVTIFSATAVGAQAPSPGATGIWLGSLAAGSSTLRLQFHLDPAVGACSLDSLDQGAKGIGCTDLKNDGQNVSFVVPAVHGQFHGTLTSDGNTLKGTWSQGKDLPITLTRQAHSL